MDSRSDRLREHVDAPSGNSDASPPARDNDVQIALETARVAARVAGVLVAERIGDIGAIRLKNASTDMVTDTDVAAGVAAVREVSSRHPNARFVVEETEVYERADVIQGSIDDSEVWLIDPLDGTTSFVHGFPCYSVSVALLRSGMPVAGAVYNIPADELFSAGVGMGTWLDDRRITCATRSSLTEALLVTGFPYDRTVTLDRQLAVLARFLRAPVHGIRRDGSAAVDCCHVASGRADGFWEFGLQPWDTAAGVVILRESGAEVTGIDGAPWTPASNGIIAANPVLHAGMTRVVLGTADTLPR